MPTKEDIKEFDNILKSLGSEPEILAERGEEIEDITPPDETLSEDLQELLETTGEEGAEGTPAGEKVDFESIMGETAGEEEHVDELPTEFQGEVTEGGEETGGEGAGDMEQISTESQDMGFEIPDSEIGMEDAGAGEGVKDFSDDLFPDFTDAFTREEPAEETGQAPVEIEADFLEAEEEMPRADESEVSDFDIGEELPGDFIKETPEVSPEGPLEEGLSDLQDSFAMDFEEPADETAEAIETIEEPFIEEEGPSMEEPSFKEEVPPLREEVDFQESEVEPVQDEAAAEEAGVEGVKEEGVEQEAEKEIPEEDFVIDEFQLPEIDEAFKAPLPEVEAGFEEAKEEIPPIQQKKEEETKEEKLQYTEKQFNAIQQTLKSLPLNLKIIVEDLIGNEKVKDENLETLLNHLIRGSSAKEIASYVSQITGKKITLPRRFEKKTGLAFIEEQRTFAYAFRENIWPILKVALPALIVFFLIAFGIYAGIYTPLRAFSIYNKGLEYIGNNMYEEANDRFATAWSIFQWKPYYYSYAEAFIEQKAFEKAAEKYKELVDMDVFYNDKKGILDWANLEANFRRNYPEAETILNRLLKDGRFDYEALLSLGDIYLNWAEDVPVEEKPEYYEKARLTYDRILNSSYADKDEFWFHMLRFAIRTDNENDVEAIKNRFESEAKKDIKVDPYIYAELGGYLITKGKLDDVKKILTRAQNENDTMPEVYYHFARYFNAINDIEMEKKALNQALICFEISEPLSRERLTKLIMTHSRIGEILYEEKQEITAVLEHYNTAIEIVEESQKMNILPLMADFGKVYYNRGNVYYYNYDFATALDNFQKAKDNFYKDLELDFKLGHINYINENYKEALTYFYNTSIKEKTNPNIIFSLANTLFQRGDYDLAQGYYIHLLNLLDIEKREMGTLRPEDNPTHRNLIKMLMQTHNNLGVTYKLLSQLDREKESQALVEFTKSSEYYDILSRNPETMVRAETINLGYQNSLFTLEPEKDMYAIFKDIPLDTTTNDWLN